MKRINNFLLLIVLLIVVLFVGCSSKDIDKDISRDNDLTDVKESDNKIAIKENEFGFNLPLLVIDTNGVKINGIEKIEATLKIYDNKSGINYLSDDPILESNIGIKIRGNTTRKLPKKQYSVELWDENGADKKESLLGMKKEADWVLNAPFEDKSFMRDVMAYHVADKTMDYAPDTRYCEVFLLDNGSGVITSENYKGVYILMEKIKRSENRVNISKTNDLSEETSFIVARNSAKYGDIELYNYGKEIALYDYDVILEYPNKDVSEEKKEYVTKSISEFERALYSDKYDDSEYGYTKYIDIESFVDYYIINEFFRNTDAGIFSTYLNKDYGEKIKAGPVWDFNTSMGNTTLLEAYGDHTGFYMAQVPWFKRLLQDKNFVDKVILRYRLLRKTYLSDEYLLEFIDENSKVLEKAAKRNFAVWPIYMSNQPEMFKDYRNDFTPYEHDIKLLDEYIQNNPQLLQPTDGMSTSYEEEISMLKKFIINRGKWIDKNIENLYKWTD